MTSAVNIPWRLLRTLLDAADAGISIREQDAEDSGAEPWERKMWAAEAAEWTAAVSEAFVLLKD
jgi:hypothetical protein